MSCCYFAVMGVKFKTEADKALATEALAKYLKSGIDRGGRLFDALGDADNQLVIGFGDDGNTVFVTDNEDKKHYTITIKED